MFTKVFDFPFRGVFQTFDGLQQETGAFKTRVEADGGTVEDLSFVDRFVKHAKANEYYEDIVAAYSPSWGVKGTTTASKLYSIIGAAQDLEQTTGSKQPTITANAQNGKSIITTDGISQLIQGTFTYAKPETVVLMGFKLITWTINDLLFDGGLVLASNSIQQRTATPNIAQNVGGVVSNENSDLTVNTAAHLRALFFETGINASKIQIDNNAETTGTLTVDQDAGGFTFGAGASDALWANVSTGTIVLLDATVDGNYAAKVEAIREFSKSEYGTP